MKDTTNQVRRAEDRLLIEIDRRLAPWRKARALKAAPPAKPEPKARKA